MRSHQHSDPSSSGREKAIAPDIRKGPIAKPLPFVFKADHSQNDISFWLDDHRDAVDRRLIEHGAVLFRGFGVTTLERFESLLNKVFREVMRNYGDLPPEVGTKRVYLATPYPAPRSILFHNEGSHTHMWPRRQVFGCIVAAESGGETPLVDCRTVYGSLSPPVRDRFEGKGLLYVRRFIEGLDVPWQRFFATEDKDEVVRICRARGATCEWTSASVLKVCQHAPAVIRHPESGECSFFNQIMLHHPFFLESEDRRTVADMCGSDLPREVYFGDGTSIEEEILATLWPIYSKESRAFSWRAGDVLLVDNMLVAHARRPYKGARKIVVGLGDPFVPATE